MTVFVDTNVIVRHFTGDPPEMARRATEYLAATDDILLADLVVAETVYVLESFYEAPRQQVAEAVRSLLAFDQIVCVDSAVLLRAVEIYEIDRLDFAEAYLIACAESASAGEVVTVDRAIDRVGTVERVEP